MQLSILGLYDYDATVFDDLQLPASVSRSNTINAILANCAEMSLVYTQPATVKTLIGIWSETMLPSWTRMATALLAQYNPIHNYDRTEEESTSGTISGNDSSTSNNTTNVENSGSDNTLHQVAGFNAATLTDADKNTTNYGSATGTTGKTTNSSSTSSQDSHTRSAHLYGNIGVTTSQDMLTAEIDLRSRYAITDLIVQDFKKKFCVLIY